MQLRPDWSRHDSTTLRTLADVKHNIRRHRVAEFLPMWLTHLAAAYADLRQMDDALPCIGEAKSIVETAGERWCEAEVNRVTGEIALMSPKRDVLQAESYFERALSVARQQQAKSWELRAAMSMARLWRDQGKREEARELLAPVHGCYRWLRHARSEGGKALVGELSP